MEIVRTNKGQVVKAIAATLLSLCTLLMSSCTSSDQPPQNLAHEKPQSEILILGTSHLAYLEGLESEMLEPVIAVLEHYAPDLIAIESSAATSVQAILAQPMLHEEPLGSYAKLHSEMGIRAQKTVDIKWPDAISAHTDPNDPCRAQPATEHCVLLAMASFEYYTAFVRWSYLRESEQDAFAINHPIIGDKLRYYKTSKNEYVILAAQLARRLKHDRLYQIDDHLEKGPTNIMLDHVGNGFEPIQSFWNKTNPDVRGIKNRQMRSQALEPGGLLKYYLWLNSEEYMDFDYDTQFAPMDRGEVGDSGYVFRAFFEARNLRMAAHITNVLAENPDKKMVVIVGASHKRFLDNYFAAMPWVNPVQLESFTPHETKK